MELLFQESPFRIGDVTATISVSGSGQTISSNPVVVFVRAALAHERCYLDGPSPENLPRSKSAPRTGFSLTSFPAGPRDTTGPETSALPLRPRFDTRMADNRTISQLEAEGYPWIGCECCKGTVWVAVQDAARENTNAQRHDARPARRQDALR